MGEIFPFRAKGILCPAFFPVLRTGQVAAALDFYVHGFDFADALHLAASEGAAALYTFDEQFIRKGRVAVPPVLGVPEG